MEKNLFFQGQGKVMEFHFVRKYWDNNKKSAKNQWKFVIGHNFVWLDNCINFRSRVDKNVERAGAARQKAESVKVLIRGKVILVSGKSGKC